MATTYAFKGTGSICGVTYAKKLRKVDEDSSAAEIDVTGGGDDAKVYEAGLQDDTLSFDALGSAPAVKDKGAVSVTWGDGSTTSWANAVCTKKKKSGSVGSAVVYSCTVRKCEA
jgi:hypothetical protein